MVTVTRHFSLTTPVLLVPIEAVTVAVPDSLATKVPSSSTQIISVSLQLQTTFCQNCYKGFSESGVFHFHKIALGQGENRVKAVSGEWEDEAMFCGVTEKELSYVYVDSNPGLNVKNWFTDVVEEERMFP